MIILGAILEILARSNVVQAGAQGAAPLQECSLQRLPTLPLATARLAQRKRHQPRDGDPLIHFSAMCALTTSSYDLHLLYQP